MSDPERHLDRKRLVRDQRDQLRSELEELVSFGELIHMSESVKALPDLRKELARALGEQSGAPKPQASSTAPRNSRGSSAEEGGSPADTAALVRAEPFGKSYQRWYSRALRVVEQLLPDRYDEFRELHRLDKRPKELDVTTYSINDYIHGTHVTRRGEDVFDTARVALTKFSNQIEILASAEDRLDSSLADIEGVLEATLLDDELGTARELLKAKYLRAAGVVAGVVLERHLKRLVRNHRLPFRKKAQISSLNDALKDAKIYDVPQWRQIQRLGDIRNVCGHDADRDPKTDEVEELISGVEKVSAAVF